MLYDINDALISLYFGLVMHGKRKAPNTIPNICDTTFKSDDSSNCAINIIQSNVNNK